MSFGRHTSSCRYGNHSKHLLIIDVKIANKFLIVYFQRKLKQSYHDSNRIDTKIFLRCNNKKGEVKKMITYVKLIL